MISGIENEWHKCVDILDIELIRFVLVFKVYMYVCH